MTLGGACRIVCLGGALALGGCVDMFTTDVPPGSARWQGTTTAGPAQLAECAPMRLDLAVHDHPFYVPALVDGRAYPTTRPERRWPRAVDAATSWWIEGYRNPDNFVQFETKRQRPVYFRAKPYAVWQGRIDGDRLALAESGSPCNREVVLTRG